MYKKTAMRRKNVRVRLARRKHLGVRAGICMCKVCLINIFISNYPPCRILLAMCTAATRVFLSAKRHVCTCTRKQKIPMHRHVVERSRFSPISDASSMRPLPVITGNRRDILTSRSAETAAPLLRRISGTVACKSAGCSAAITPLCWRITAKRSIARRYCRHIIVSVCHDEKFSHGAPCRILPSK